MRHKAAGARVLHFLCALALLAAGLPPLLNWEQSRPVSSKELARGVVLVDASASVRSAPEWPKRLLEMERAFGDARYGDVQWVLFSEGCLPPLGQGREGRGTDLVRALRDLEPYFASESPRWLWLLSDGGFAPPAELPPRLMSARKYVSAMAGSDPVDDVGLRDLTTDPVWFTRTTAPVRATVFRGNAEKALDVDALCFVNGSLAGTARARFAAGALEAAVEFTASAPHLGAARVEVAVAEGQGGSRRENDRLLHEVRVLRDKIRVLRVVGRPTWSSKFLRDALVRREDVDLVDFHILRSMQDLQSASQNLALIPFPVDELFVENINSFDLIIWQDFDSNSYSFFKDLYLRNIKKFVRDGGGLLLWAGDLPWDLGSGELRELAPQRGSGSQSVLVNGPLEAASEHRLLGERLSRWLAESGSLPLRVFPGELAEGTRVLLRCAGEPILVLRDFGAGRVAQFCSDGLWQLEYNAGRGGEGLYGELTSQVVLWLLRHPDLVAPGFSMPPAAAAGESLEVRLASPVGSKVLVFERVGGQARYEHEIASGAGAAVLPAPPEPGVYQVSIKGGGDPLLLGVHALENEFLPAAARQKNLSRLEPLGFQRAVPGEIPWSDTLEGATLTRTTGAPWHHNWGYLSALLALLFGHWWLISTAPAKAARPAP